MWKFGHSSARMLLKLGSLIIQQRKSYADSSRIQIFMLKRTMTELSTNRDLWAFFYEHLLISKSFKLQLIALFFFVQVESEVIIHLDHLIESGMKGDEEYKELFSQM